MNGDGDSWRRKALPWLWRYGTPALLCAVALFQQYQVHARDLSPWKGGGFGMFSTVDAPSARFLRLTLITDSGEVAVKVPEQLRGHGHRLRTLPDLAMARRFAASLVEFTWATPYECNGCR